MNQDLGGSQPHQKLTKLNESLIKESRLHWVGRRGCKLYPSCQEAKLNSCGDLLGTQQRSLPWLCHQNSPSVDHVQCQCNLSTQIHKGDHRT